MRKKLFFISYIELKYSHHIHSISSNKVQRGEQTVY